MFDETSIEKSNNIEKMFANISSDFDIDVIYLSKIAKTSAIDGLHYDIENHSKIADVLIDYCIKLFK